MTYLSRIGNFLICIREKPKCHARLAGYQGKARTGSITSPSTYISNPSNNEQVIIERVQVEGVFFETLLLLQQASILCSSFVHHNCIQKIMSRLLLLVHYYELPSLTRYVFRSNVNPKPLTSKQIVPSTKVSEIDKRLFLKGFYIVLTTFNGRMR